MPDRTTSRRRPDPGRGRQEQDQGRQSRPQRRHADGNDQPPPSPPRFDELLAVVRFKGNRKSYFHNRRDVGVRVGDHCLVDADRGCDLGQVVYLGTGRPIWWDDAVHQGIQRLATVEDLARVAELRREEREAWDIGLGKIRDHRLGMELAGIERRWDRGKLTFYFLANGRVDFRALVRDLAGVFRTRIELRQIGVRDEAKLKGGLGICGREYCCATFLPAFESVALRMAKDQQLPLNPAKLSGPCSRLRCCLSYEHGQYRAMLRDLPRLGSEVRWQGRRGRARKLEPLRALVTVQMVDGDREMVDVPAGELSFDRPASSGGSGKPGRREDDRS